MFSFTSSMDRIDPIMADVLNREQMRQTSQIELIASENIVSRAVLEALGDTITNKTVEGYPGKRFHAGAKIVDEAENLAIERATRLFGCKFANVQPHSGSQANQAVFVALLKPGDTVLSMDLNAGGHLSHGAPPNMSGKWFNIVHYGVHQESGLLNYKQLEKLAHKHRPKLIIAGGSAYPRVIDFERIRSVADAVDTIFLVDMAHIAGLIAGKAHPSPFPHAHIVSTTTTKTLRGPRGAILLTNDSALARKLRSSVFPGTQGSIHLNVIAAKAVCLGEALQPEFREYANQVVENARTLATILQSRGITVLTGSTDTHLLLADVKSAGLTGDQAEKRLENAGITCNKNAIPGDPAQPSKWTGVRLGTSAGTTRGFKTAEFEIIGQLIADLWHSANYSKDEANAKVNGAKEAVIALCEQFPTYL